MSVTIDGQAVHILSGTLNVSYSLNQRPTAEFTVRDPDGSLDFNRGMSVVISEGLDIAWTGYVNDVDKQRVGGGPRIDHVVTCIDQKYLAAKRIAARTYNPGTTAGQVVNDLWTQYLSAEGVTLGTIETGATLSEGMLINYQPVSDALDALCDVSTDYVWDIDAGKVLSFHHRSSQGAPWDATGSTIKAYPSPRLTTGNSDYRNVEWILGGLAVTDDQVETRTGDGETRAFTMSFPIAEVPQVKLNGVLQTVGIKGLENDSTYQFGWNKGDAVISQSSKETVLTTADSIEVTYRGQYAVVAQVPSIDQIEATRDIEGGTGLVEHASSPPNITNVDKAFSAGFSQLETYARPGRKLVFECDHSGLMAGQWLTVNLPELGLNNLGMLIDAVSVRDMDQGTLRWSVSAIEGPQARAWQKVLGNSEPIVKDDLVSVGSGTIVALMTITAEKYGWSEVMDNTVWACPIFPLTLPSPLC